MPVTNTDIQGHPSRGQLVLLEKVLHGSNIQGVGTMSAEWTEKAEGGEEPLEGARAQRSSKEAPIEVPTSASRKRRCGEPGEET